MLWGASLPGRALEGHPRQGKERPWAVGVVGLLPGPLLAPGHRSAALSPEPCSAAPRGDLPSQPAWLRHGWASSEPWPLGSSEGTVFGRHTLLLLPCTFTPSAVRCFPCLRASQLPVFSHTWFCHPGSPCHCYPSVTPVTHLEANRWGPLTSSLPVSGPSVSVGPVS